VCAVIGNAFACLSDAKKRELYNVTGEDPTQNAPRSASRSDEAGGGGGEYYQEEAPQDMTAEEMFNMARDSHAHARTRTHTHALQCTDSTHAHALPLSASRLTLL
jgi:DnaJ-class molecular chaperone